jgi:hypothetical protein
MFSKVLENNVRKMCVKIMLLSYFFKAFIHLLKAAYVTVKDIPVLNLLSWLMTNLLQIE